MSRDSKGFTVVDLLVVIAMIGVLVGLLLPALQQSREAARRNVCTNNMRELTLGMQRYNDSFGVFPPALVVGPNISSDLQREPQPREGSYWSWAFWTAPFFGQQQFFDQVDPAADFPFWSYFGPGHPSDGLSHISLKHKLFTCPSDPRFPIPNYFDLNNKHNQAAIMSYMGVNGRNQFAEENVFETFADGQDGMLYVNSTVEIDEVTDGISNTVLLGERPPDSNLFYGWQWAGAGNSPGGVFFGTTDVVLGVHEILSSSGADYYHPGELNDPENDHRYHFWSFHPNGGNWAFVDGSTRFLTYAVDSPINETTDPGNTPPTVLAHFATRAGGAQLIDFLIESEINRD